MGGKEEEEEEEEKEEEEEEEEKEEEEEEEEEEETYLHLHSTLVWALSLRHKTSGIHSTSKPEILVAWAPRSPDSHKFSKNTLYSVTFM